MKRFLMILAGLALLFAGASAPAEDLFIQAAKVYTMTGPPLTPGAVLVSGGKIVKVGPRLTPPAGAKVIDLSSGVLMPGLVDAYSSIGIASQLLVAWENNDIGKFIRRLRGKPPEQDAAPEPA